MEAKPSNPQNDKYKISAEEFDALINNLIQQLIDSGKKFDGVMGVCRGGLLPAVYISHALDIPLIFGIKDHHTNNILVVDDVADTGKTLETLTQSFRTRYLEDYLTLTVATVIFKERSMFKPDFYAKEINEWVVFPYEREKDTVSKSKM